jgi:hypothetical protein
MKRDGVLKDDADRPEVLKEHRGLPGVHREHKKRKVWAFMPPPIGHNVNRG